jgi:hypothetical protein
MNASSRSTASSPRPVSSNRSPSNPPVCDSSWRTVTDQLAAASSTPNSGTYRRTGVSRSTRPSSTSCITSAAVQTFVTEPIWNRVSVVASTPVSRLTTPVAASTSASPTPTAIAAPGTS